MSGDGVWLSLGMRGSRHEAALTRFYSAHFSRRHHKVPKQLIQHGRKRYRASSGGGALLVTSGIYGAVGLALGSMTLAGYAILLFLAKDSTKAPVGTPNLALAK